MICPFCNHADTKVVDKRDNDERPTTRRRRQCLSCHQRFTTYERVESADLMIVKRDKRREVFSLDKLRSGILLATKKRPVSSDDIDRLIEAVDLELRSGKRREVPSELIGAVVMEQLKDLDHVAYIRFASVYQSFTDIESFQDQVQQLLENKHIKPE